MKKVSIILLGMITLPTYANIASTAYTDAEFKGVSDAIKLKADKGGYTANGVLQTGADGKVTSSTLKTNMIETGAVTNSKLASGIGLDKLDVGELPTSGKHIMIWNSATNKYVFEPFEDVATRLQCPADQYDIGFAQCVDPSVMGDGYGYRNDSTGVRGPDSSNADKYGLTTDQTWAVEFSSYGVVKGTALCSSTNGDFTTAGTPDESGSGSTKYCWCKMTHPVVSSWVFAYVGSSSSYCSWACAYLCGNYVNNVASFRRGVFGSAGD